MNRDEIADRLNLSGDFFHRACAKSISDKGWQVLEDVPVAWPPDKPDQKNSVLDIQATFIDEQEGFTTIAIVECEKADPNYKTWFFFPKRFGAKDALVLSVSALMFRKSDVPILLKIDPNRARIEQLIGPVSLPSLDPEGKFEDYTCSMGREISLQGSKISQKRIYEACRQVSIAESSIQYDYQQMLKQEIVPLIRKTPTPVQELPSPPDGIIKMPIVAFVPVILTTADLKIAKFKEEDVDIRTGKIDPSKFEYLERDWLIYEYPLPGSQQRRSHSHLETLVGRDEFRKLHILVANSLQLEKFFEGLKQIQLRPLTTGSS